MKPGLYSSADESRGSGHILGVRGYETPSGPYEAVSEGRILKVLGRWVAAA